MRARSLLVVIVIGLVLAMISGCSAFDGDNRQMTATQTTSEQAPLLVEGNPFAQFYEISWLTGIRDDQYVDGGMDQKMLEERYNVSFNIWKISNYDPEGLTKMLQSGSIPDISYIPHAPLDARALFERGFTRTVSLDLYKEYFPYYYEQMLQHAPSSFAYNNVRDDRNELTEDYYGISFITWHYKWYYNVPLMRLDWLEKIGYDINEHDLSPIRLTDDKLGRFSSQLFQTNHIFTHEEMNDILRAFTEDDPNGSSQDDTYGAVIFHHSFRSHWVDLYWGQFGVIASDGNFLYKDEKSGHIVPWYAHTGYRDYLQWAVSMRNAGYMRTLPEGFESQAPQGAWYDNLLENWKTGKIGYFSADMQYLCRPDFPEYSDRQPPQSIWLSTDQKDATFVAFPALAGLREYGTWGTRRYALDAFSEGKFRTYNVSANVSDHKLARVLTMWNDRYVNEDSSFWREVLYGIENVHYRWTGQPWVSGMIRTPDEHVPFEKRRYGSFGGSFSANVSPVLNEAMSQFYTFFFEHDWAIRYTIDPYKYIGIQTMGPDLFLQHQTAWREISSDIQTIIDSFRNRSWDNEIFNMQKEWNDYTEQLMEAGLADLIRDFYNNPDFAIYRRPDLDNPSA